MVEGKNSARGQMIGRTSQNKTLNFVVNDKPEPDGRQLRAGAGHPGVSQQPAGRIGWVASSSSRKLHTRQALAPRAARAYYRAMRQEGPRWKSK